MARYRPINRSLEDIARKLERHAQDQIGPEHLNAERALEVLDMVLETLRKYRVRLRRRVRNG